MADHAKIPKSSKYRSEWTIKLSYLVLLDDLPPSAVVLYCHLLRFMNNGTRLAWPSWETLERVSGLSRRTISRQLKVLESRGLIVRGEGTTATTVYHLPPPAHVYCDFADPDEANAEDDADPFAVPKRDFYNYLKKRGLLEDFFTSASVAEKRSWAAQTTAWFEKEDGDRGGAPPVAAAGEVCGPRGTEGCVEEAAQNGGEDPVREIQAAFDAAMDARVGAGCRLRPLMTASLRDKVARQVAVSDLAHVAAIVTGAVENWDQDKRDTDSRLPGEPNLNTIFNSSFWSSFEDRMAGRWSRRARDRGEDFAASEPKRGIGWDDDEPPAQGRSTPEPIAATSWPGSSDAHAAVDEKANTCSPVTSTLDAGSPAHRSSAGSALMLWLKGRTRSSVSRALPPRVAQGAE